MTGKDTAGDMRGTPERQLEFQRKALGLQINIFIFFLSPMVHTIDISTKFEVQRTYIVNLEIVVFS